MSSTGLTGLKIRILAAALFSGDSAGKSLFLPFLASGGHHILWFVALLPSIFKATNVASP